MDTSQHPANQEEIDKLRSQNAELKKDLEREHVLHQMLYKEWKELSEQMAANEQKVYEDARPKNLFYKYSFFLLLICVIPAYYFFVAGKENKRAVSSSAVATIPTANQDSAISKVSNPVIDSQAATKNETANRNEIADSKPLAQPVVAKDDNRFTTLPDSPKPKMTVIAKRVIQVPLDSAGRDSIYWMGWNAYFNKKGSHFRKSTEKYKVWLQGWKDGRVDAQKLVAKKDSLKR